MVESIKRTGEYRRISALETLLEDLNYNLASANDTYLTNTSEQFSKIFVVGAPRSGTTLFMQWLANSGLVAYPTNLLSRFFGAPLVGAKIQQLLTDPRYNFRDEILDFNSEIDFSSDNGKTKGALAPNEFWYFWRRFLPFEQLDYMPPDELREKANLTGFRDELNALANIFEKPFAMKAMIMNQNIPELAEQFEKALFIWIYRDPIFNIQSVLEARKRQYGDFSEWYSFKLKEYPELNELTPVESVSGQILSINRSVELAIRDLPESSKLIVKYEDFCSRPQYFFDKISSLLGDFHSKPDYRGQTEFFCSEEWRLKEFSQEEVESEYRRIVF